MTSASITVSNFLSRLEGVKRSGANWAARCPCRMDDMNPSLSIGEGKDGRVLVTCHRGEPCSVDQICEAMGINRTELFPPKGEEPSTTRVKVKAEKAGKLTLIATYDYRDAEGNLLFQKQRFIDEQGKKTFRQRRLDKETGEWSYQLGEVPRVLYRLPEVAAAVAQGKPIWVVEGEKDADTLVELGFEATTMPNGAGTWLDIHTETLAGAEVFIIADNDEVGRKHANQVVKELKDAGCTVRPCLPAEGYKDITDMVDAGLTTKNLVNLFEDAEDDGDTPMAELARGIELILGRDDLNEEQRINRASILLNSYQRGTDVDAGRLVNWEEFLLEEDDDSYDWVIPNLLEKQERVIVVAAEGVGKTMLARQIAICSAAGLHPFTMSKINPVRTLMVDLENPARIIRRTSRTIMNAAKRFGHTNGIEAEILIKPSGLDLLKPSDRAVLEQAIEKAKPELLILGPLYKAFLDPGNRTSEAVAIEVARYLDTLRDVYGCAMWLEHHAPLGSSMGSRELRPFGSAVWSRWPEFGLSLTPDPTAPEGFVYNVSHFRGARDKRQFPTKMKRGKVFPFDVVEFMKVDL